MPTPNDQPPDADGLTPRYYALKAGMDAWMEWQDLTPRQKLDRIVDTYPPEEWVREQNLNVLAVFYDDPVVWLRVVTVGREIGVDTRKLEEAVRTILSRHASWKFSQLRQGDSSTGDAYVRPD